MLAHHAAIATMRTTNVHEDDRLGIVLNLIPAWPADESPEALQVADGVDAVQNRLFLGAVFDGAYPDEVLGYHRRWAVSDRIDLDRLKTAVEPLDYLGVNYYNVNHIRHTPGAPPMPAWPGPGEAEISIPAGELTQMGWGVDPEGLTWMLERVGRLLPDLPLLIMENGAAFPDQFSGNGSIEDPRRIAYLQSHIGAVRDARERGVNVTGYFVWSLLDNFEWARGYSMHFGIIHVDRSTMVRTVKASGRWYRDFLMEDTGPSDLP
jgi:beta-glucosidase